MTRVVRNQKPKESLSVIYSWISLLCWKWVEFLPSPASLVHFRPTHAFAWLSLHSPSPVRRHYTAYFGDCIKGWLELPIDGRKIFWIALVLCYELCSVIDLGISRLCLSQTGAKPKLTATWSMAFSRALESLSSHCLLVIFTKLWLAVAIDLFWSRKAQTSDSSRSFQPLPRRGVFGAVMKSHKMFTWWWFRIGFSEFYFESTNFEM